MFIIGDGMQRVMHSVWLSLSISHAITRTAGGGGGAPAEPFKDHCNKTVDIYEDVASPEVTNINRGRPMTCVYRFRSFRGAPRDWVLRLRFKKFKVGTLVNATYCEGGFLQVSSIYLFCFVAQSEFLSFYLHIDLKIGSNKNSFGTHKSSILPYERLETSQVLRPVGKSVGSIQTCQYIESDQKYPTSRRFSSNRQTNKQA